MCSDHPCLGRGSFGKILRIVEKSSGQQFAMKIMDRSFFSSRGMDKQLAMEVEAQRRCSLRRCRHVVRSLDSVIEGNLLFVRMELCCGNIAKMAASRQGGHLVESDMVPWATQLLLGLFDMHCVGVLHRDIKPDNLLLSADGTLKIADFGWAADLHEKPTSVAGTFSYMAPEVLDREAQTEAVDVWSAGATLVQLLTGRILVMPPAATGFSMTNQLMADHVQRSTLLREILMTCPPPQQLRPAHVSHCCWALLRRMLNKEVGRRVSVPQALHHPWLSGPPNFSPRASVRGQVLRFPTSMALVPLQLMTRPRSPPAHAVFSKTPLTSRSEASTAVPSDTGSPPTSPPAVPPAAMPFQHCVVRAASSQTLFQTGFEMSGPRPRRASVHVPARPP